MDENILGTASDCMLCRRQAKGGEAVTTPEEIKAAAERIGRLCEIAAMMNSDGWDFEWTLKATGESTATFKKPPAPPATNTETP
jgi:hypothetical protein